MRKATFKPSENEDWRDRDVTPIVDALARLGIEISPNDACAAWDAYSESLAAGWLIYPKTDAGFFSCLERYLDIEEDNACKACRGKAQYFKHTCR